MVYPLQPSPFACDREVLFNRRGWGSSARTKSALVSQGCSFVESRFRPFTTGHAMSDDDYFLFICEQLWRFSEEGEALLMRAAHPKEAGDENATGEIADAIDRNHIERRLLLLRAHEMAVAG